MDIKIASKCSSLKDEMSIVILYHMAVTRKIRYDVSKVNNYDPLSLLIKKYE